MTVARPSYDMVLMVPLLPLNTSVLSTTSAFSRCFKSVVLVVLLGASVELDDLNCPPESS